MKHYFQSAKAYVLLYKKDFIIGAGVVIGLAVLIAAIVLVAHNINRPAEIVYQPAKACELLTLDEAKGLLGDKALLSGKGDLTLKGNLATSKCGYADGTPDENNMIVAAIIVRSGINDLGVEQNVDEFNSGIPTDNVEVVKDLGDAAYFNQVTGQLNVLNGKQWIIFSYGVGSDPLSNTLDQAVELAHKVVSQ